MKIQGIEIRKDCLLSTDVANDIINCHHTNFMTVNIKLRAKLTL